MILYKSCPRCSGDRSLEKDIFGWYLICLPCGYVTYPIVEEESVSERRRRKTA